MQELRESHSKEIEKINYSKDELIKNTRGAEVSEMFRMREDLQTRLQEKQDEVRSLKSTIEVERLRVENSLREIEDVKSDNRHKQSIIDQLRTDMASIEVLKVELRQSQDQCRELKENLQKDVVVEKNHLQSRIEVISDALESSRESIRDLEYTNSTLNNEITRLKEEIFESRKAAENANELTRENERLRASSISLRDEVKELSNAIQTLQGETRNHRESMSRSTTDVDRLRDALLSAESKSDSLNINFKEMQTRATAAEAALYEHRQLTSSLSQELDFEKRLRIETERKARDGLERLDVLRSDIGKL
jgi:chromosome segregation ATPase